MSKQKMVVPVYVEYELPPGADLVETAASARNRIAQGVRSCVPFNPSPGVTLARIYGAEVGAVGESELHVNDPADFDGQGPDLLFVWTGKTVKVLDFATRKEIADIHLDYWSNHLEVVVTDPAVGDDPTQLIMVLPDVRAACEAARNRKEE